MVWEFGGMREIGRAGLKASDNQHKIRKRRKEREGERERVRERERERRQSAFLYSSSRSANVDHLATIQLKQKNFTCLHML